MVHTIILAILLIASIIYNLLYKRQIRDFVRQLRFHGKEESNREIAAELKSRCILDMQNELNQLLKRQKIQRIAYEQREEKIGQMVTDISHDIRTPLTSVIGYFQMLDECENDAEREHYKNIIYQRLQTLSFMLDEFFTYSKLSQNSCSNPKDICNVGQILCETLFLFYDDLNAKGIQAEIHIPEERFELYGNSEDFNRIFMNIMKNILTHGCKEVYIFMKKEVDFTKIVFENRTEEALPRDLSAVFERFYKGDKARSGQASTGLGLCIVKELVEQMGGTVTAFSKGAGWFGIELRF